MNRKLNIITILILSCPIVFRAYPAEASEINISGNGGDSINEAVVNNSNVSNINQSNNLQSANIADSDSDTGSNESVNNTSGENMISTGDASNITNIKNDGNILSVATGCCGESVKNPTVTISNNGAGSNSTAQSESSDFRAISTQNSSDISNQITQKSITGQNLNNFNYGSGRIITGDIYSETNIDNTGVNKTNLNIKSIKNNGADVIVSGNGAYSSNNVKLDKRTKQIISNENNAVIKNYIKSEYITGNNKSYFNAGLFDIITGGIFAKTSINNSLNKNILDIVCCVKKAYAEEKAQTPEHNNEDKPSQQPATTPTSSGSTTSISSGNSGSSGSSGTGSAQGEVAGITARHLPITGNNWLFFSLLGNIIMLFLGAYLRLRSGNAPPAYAIA